MFRQIITHNVLIGKMFLIELHNNKLIYAFGNNLMYYPANRTLTCLIVDNT